MRDVGYLFGCSISAHRLHEDIRCEYSSRDQHPRPAGNLPDDVRDTPDIHLSSLPVIDGAVCAKLRHILIGGCLDIRPDPRVGSVVTERGTTTGALKGSAGTRNAAPI